MTIKTEVTQAEKADKKQESLLDLVIVVIEAVVIALVLKTFLFQPFNIPTPSMVPTLLVGDYLFVSKFSYGYSKHSFPFGLNLFEGRFLSSEPKRGDVIVFKWPADNSTDYIKRLIGLPGDKIQVKGGVVYINDASVKRERIEDIKTTVSKCRSFTDNKEVFVPQYRETTPEGQSYTIQKVSEVCPFLSQPAADDTEIFRVPEGHYFMMGDNRDNSADSRFAINVSNPKSGGVGFVPRENLIGRARFLFFSIDESASWLAPWRWPSEIRWSRLGQTIR